MAQQRRVGPDFGNPQLLELLERHARYTARGLEAGRQLTLGWQALPLPEAAAKHLVIQENHLESGPKGRLGLARNQGHG